MFQMVALDRTLFVEGNARDRSVGKFRGIVLALGWYPNGDDAALNKWSNGRPPSVHYLVSDRRKRAPVWVSAADLSRQDWISASEAEAGRPGVAAASAPRIAAPSR